MDKAIFLESLDAQRQTMVEQHQKLRSKESEDSREIAWLSKSVQGPFRSMTISGKTLSDQEVRKMAMDIIQDALQIPEEVMIASSDADSWLITLLNKLSMKVRRRKYQKRVRKNFNGVKVVSEGDSWFQFPLILKDIIDWLIKDKKIAVYSLGAGGDLFYNMFQQKQYLRAIDKVGDPDFFLVSGGGNDLLGGGNLYHLMHDYQMKYELQPELYLNHHFDNLLLVLRYLYSTFYIELTQKYPDIHIFCHGYDYAKPSDKRGPGFFQAILQSLTDNGQWLYEPMRARGIKNSATQHSIVVAMIDSFNEMQKQMAADFDNVHYLDLRLLAPEREDWWDEIHPKSKYFKKMAERYKTRIKLLTD